MLFTLLFSDIQSAPDWKKNLVHEAIKASKRAYAPYSKYHVGSAIRNLAVIVYQSIGKGDPLHLIKNPIIVLAILLPFVPGFFMALLAKRNRAKASKILKPLYGMAKTAKMSEETLANNSD